MHPNVRWHVVFTKQQCERKVVNALTKKGFECYCPYHSIDTAQWKNGDKPFEKPLFSSYVFIRCTEDQFPEIKKTPWVINFLYRLDRPAVVSKEELAAIAYALSRYQKIQLLKTGLNPLLNRPIGETESVTYPLTSLGVTLVASKERVTSDDLVFSEEPKRTLQRLSYRFRLAWR